MEISFELMREAGLRMPGPIGNMIGIVGGLIIGQAAVTANLISPMIVIVDALTALGSFSIPNEETFRGIPHSEIRYDCAVRLFRDLRVCGRMAGAADPSGRAEKIWHRRI